MEFFLQHKTVIMRSLGALMLVVGFVIHFWSVPQEGLTANQIAAVNVARMEASVAGKSSSSKASTKKDDSAFLKELKNTQKKQIEYMTIISMIFGILFLGYSFLPKKEDN